MQNPQPVCILVAADVLRCERQCMLVLQETVTSYTATCLIDNEQPQSVRQSLIQLSLSLRPLDGPFAVIRTDNAPGFHSLVKDETLDVHRLSLELGHTKNINKNPVAEKCYPGVGGGPGETEPKRRIRLTSRIEPCYSLSQQSHALGRQCVE